MTPFPMTDLPLSDLVGLVGVSLYVVAYTGVQAGCLDGNRLGYCCMTGLAASCILFSCVIGAFNLASALVNGIFLMVSLLGGLRIAFAARAARRRQLREQRIDEAAGLWEAGQAHPLGRAEQSVPVLHDADTRPIRLGPGRRQIRVRVAKSALAAARTPRPGDAVPYL